jgi:prepilin-type N-terminal cleavage/methylation domain-containing protein
MNSNSQRSAFSKRSAFTLIEVLIVVVIMAVLAATIIPQFASSTDDAKSSAAKFNLHTLRSQIEMFKMQHNSLPPASAAAFSDDMTKFTDVSGGTAAAKDSTHIYGPYVQGGALPPNPYDGVNTVTAGTSPFTAPVGTTGGWLYDFTTGAIAPNTTGHVTE